MKFKRELTENPHAVITPTELDHERPFFEKLTSTGPLQCAQRCSSARFPVTQSIGNRLCNLMLALRQIVQRHELSRRNLSDQATRTGHDRASATRAQNPPFNREPRPTARPQHGNSHGTAGSRAKASSPEKEPYRQLERPHSQRQYGR